MNPNQGGSWGGYMASTAIPALPTLHIGSIQDLMTPQLHTLAPTASIYNSANLNVVGWDSCKISILLRDHKSQSRWYLGWINVLNCYSSSSNTWYRVHTRFDDPTITYTHPHGIHLQQRKPKCWLRFLRNLDSEGPRIPIKVVVGVDKWPQLLSQLFKHLL